MPRQASIIWLVFWVLFLLHQDVWFWNDRRLVLDVIPIGLAYHVGFSVASALLWLAAMKYAWPARLETWADETDPTPAREKGPHA